MRVRRVISNRYSADGITFKTRNDVADDWQSDPEMRRFALIVFLLWAIFAVMIVAARGYGESHPGPDQLSEVGFGVCDGKPCFMGITMDVTTMDTLNSR